MKQGEETVRAVVKTTITPGDFLDRTVMNIGVMVGAPSAVDDVGNGGKRPLPKALQWVLRRVV